MDLEGEERSVAPDQGHLWSGLRELYDSMSPGRRVQFYFVLALMIAGASAEIATIGAVLPFLSLLADPSRMDQWPATARRFNSALRATPQHPVLGNPAARRPKTAAPGNRSGKASPAGPSAITEAH